MEMELCEDKESKNQGFKQPKNLQDLINQKRDSILINEKPSKELDLKHPIPTQTEISNKFQTNPNTNENNIKQQDLPKNVVESKIENKNLEKMRMQLTEKIGKSEPNYMGKVSIEESKEKKSKEEDLPEKIITFDINSLIFLVDSEFSEEILKNSEAIVNLSKCQAIFIEQKDIGPDSKFCACRIKSENFKRSRKALKMILKNYSEYLKLKYEKIDEFEILIYYLVPIKALSSFIDKESKKNQKN